MELLGAADGCWELESTAEEAEADEQPAEVHAAWSTDPSLSTVALGACDEAAAGVAVLRRLVSLNLMAPIAPTEARRRASYERLNAFGLLRAPPPFSRGARTSCGKKMTEYPA